MITFSAAAHWAEATGLPAVQGFAVKTSTPAAATGVLSEMFPELTWSTSARSGGWTVYTPSSQKTGGPKPPDLSPLSLGKAWDAVRKIEELQGVETAEPLLLTRSPVTNGAEAGEHFRLWGRISAERLEQIRRGSGRDAMQWSLKALYVTEAWAAWKEKHGDARLPGEGVLVAHPDTGYTHHPRVLRFLQNDGQGNRGTNFVERQANGDPAPDAFDPMTERSLGHFPGHGTGTAGVIASANDDPTKPWGVAPGAKVLPLRVSTSVIHLSFQNVCDAFDEAIRQKAHVISMSLGGPAGSALLNDRVARALEAGIIVVSAAGNYAPTVVFPAKVPGIIACAASNALGSPWRFSGMGEEVAVTAPGELVWHDTAVGDPSNGPFEESAGSGTSFATASVAGLAALWLSYWGRDKLLEIYGGNASLIPFGFRHALEKCCDGSPKFVRGGGFGKGIARADVLLTVKPKKDDADQCRKRVLDDEVGRFINFPVSSWWSILTLPTLAADGTVRLLELGERNREQERLQTLLGEVLGDEDRFSGGGGVLSLVSADLREMATLAAADIGLRNAAARAARGERGCVSPAAVRRYLLRPGNRSHLSAALHNTLEKARKTHRERWVQARPELEAVSPYHPRPAPQAGQEYGVPTPTTRRLRAFAFDPSLATRSDAVTVNAITIPVVFERGLEPGPVGDYLAVIDVDPASDCVYAPVDLNHPHLLAQDGLPRSEGNPQFHQQMVYAVGMKTIRHFEEALGRPLFWSPLRPWDPRGRDRAYAADSLDDRDQFVRRLRLYPHALREQNAYYSPQKRAILFGYFPAGDDDPGVEYPGGIVFTCLAHDIIAHEMTHAILDGMHVHYTDPTNPDVLAFHEAFADIVALFQRFTYPELLRDQIARSRGQLDAGTLLTRLALQFGQATGRRQALRDALGFVVWQDEERRAVGRERGQSSASPITIAEAARDFDENSRGAWRRFHADPSLLARVEEPHDRGSFLVAAVFDAYLTIYQARVADLKRIATGGTGVLPDGDLHPDLVNRMADEAAKAAAHVLRMCIRAMDYVPPVDITFGEFLRALITADYDLVPDDDRRYRVAFIEAFRKWGIYPRDVRTLSEESLRWSPPRGDAAGALFPFLREMTQEAADLKVEARDSIREALLRWQPGEEREGIFKAIRDAQARLQTYLRGAFGDNRAALEDALPGIDLGRSFQVANLRPARRIGPDGRFQTEMVFEVLQQGDALPYDPQERREEARRRRQAREDRRERGEEVPVRDRVPFRGGVTMIVGLDDLKIRYAIYKRRDNAERQTRQREFLLRASGGDTEAAEYSTVGFPSRWYSDKDVLADLTRDRAFDREAMRASSCACRRTRMLDAEAKKAREAAEKAGLIMPGGALAEPFALLHRP